MFYSSQLYNRELESPNPALQRMFTRGDEQSPLHAPSAIPSCLGQMAGLQPSVIKATQVKIPDQKERTLLGLGFPSLLPSFSVCG